MDVPLAKWPRHITIWRHNDRTVNCHINIQPINILIKIYTWSTIKAIFLPIEWLPYILYIYLMTHQAKRILLLVNCHLSPQFYNETRLQKCTHWTLNIILVLSRDREQAAVPERPLDFTTITNFHQLREWRMSVWGNKAGSIKKTGGKEDLVVAVICWSETN